MAEVKVGSLYRVIVTEYDCGVQRVYPDDTKFFTTLTEAEAYQADWQKDGSPEYYWRAEIRKM